jgi:hypothetical protein
MDPELSWRRIQGVRVLVVTEQYMPRFSIPNKVRIAHLVSAMARSPDLSQIELMWASGERIRSGDGLQECRRIVRNTRMEMG